MGESAFGWRARAARVGLFALLCFGAGALVAEETLVVVDSANSILGPVISAGTGGSKSWTFVYRQGGNWTTLRTSGPSRVESALTLIQQTYLYYSAANCAGSPVMATVQDCCGLDLAPITVVAGSDIFAIDSSTTVNLTVASNKDTTGAPGDCTNFPPELINGMAVNSWGTITFSPPLSVILNPQIFNDGFGTGDPTRWSNY